jgi:hypothetical protein
MTVISSVTIKITSKIWYIKKVICFNELVMNLIVILREV